MSTEEITEELKQKLTDEEYLALLLCQMEEDWNRCCDIVKKKRGGRYPNEWFTRMNASGLMHEISQRWSKR